jgi:hypothetical protein
MAVSKRSEKFFEKRCKKQSPTQEQSTKMHLCKSAITIFSPQFSQIILEIQDNIFKMQN